MNGVSGVGSGGSGSSSSGRIHVAVTSGVLTTTAASTARNWNDWRGSQQRQGIGLDPSPQFQQPRIKSTYTHACTYTHTCVKDTIGNQNNISYSFHFQTDRTDDIKMILDSGVDFNFKSAGF